MPRPKLVLIEGGAQGDLRPLLEESVMLAAVALLRAVEDLDYVRALDAQRVLDEDLPKLAALAAQQQA